MSAPTIEPTRRRPAEVPAPEDLSAGQRIWVYRNAAWRPGVVMNSSDRAVTVRYRPTEARGTGVDTVTRDLLALRDIEDPYVDMPALSMSTKVRRYPEPG
jgi:hypothetical protein